MVNPKNIRVIVTGCGYKPLQREFCDHLSGLPTHSEIILNGIRCKLNIGAAIACTLSQNGYIVHMISKTEKSLLNLKQEFCSRFHCLPDTIEYSAFDLLDSDQVNNFVVDLPKDKPIYWVQSIGLSAGSYQVKDDNPYLPIEDIDAELIEAESRTLLRGTHLLAKKLVPLFRKQKETRVVIITSLSAIRSYDIGATHCASKAALDTYTEVLRLALSKEHIFVTTIRPGIVDTGMYDHPAVIAAVKHVGAEYGWSYTDNQIPLITPLAIGKLVREVLSSEAHITSINLVARGQWPHEGS